MNEEQALQDLKAKMSDTQRQEMVEILSNELKRREGLKQPGAGLKVKSSVKDSSIASGLGSKQLGEVYAEVDDKVKNLRVKKLQEKLQQAKKRQRKVEKLTRSRSSFAVPSLNLPSIKGVKGSLGKMALVYLLLVLGAAKVMFSTGVVDESTLFTDKSSSRAMLAPAPAALTGAAAQNESAVAINAVQGAALEPVANWSPIDKQILTSLDKRRVELEERSRMLDERERELKRQNQELASRLAELRGLSERLKANRKQKDVRYETRLEQLAGVYSSMAPKEAAPLIARLDDSIALGLLQRMPGKRMGQILSLMDTNRAIELTRSLTNQADID